MNSKQLKIAEQIDAWAREQIKIHRRECRDRGCAGKSLIWWVTRHPETAPEIANETAINFVISQQVCERLEIRLVDGQLRWLPRERGLYKTRSQSDRLTLLQRVGRRVEESLPPTLRRSGNKENENEINNGAAAAKPEIKNRSSHKNKEGFPEYPRRDSVPQRGESSGDTLDWVDSLTRRNY